jgi:hypothetical protein
MLAAALAAGDVATPSGRGSARSAAGDAATNVSSSSKAASNADAIRGLTAVPGENVRVASRSR